MMQLLSSGAVVTVSGAGFGLLICRVGVAGTRGLDYAVPPCLHVLLASVCFMQPLVLLLPHLDAQISGRSVAALARCVGSFGAAGG